MKKKVRLDEIKRISLDGLVLFSTFCREHNLTYFISYGTLLGAIRHKGFIPWDDDIDVLMPREDYEKMLSIKGSLNTENWELLSYKTNEKYLYFWSKFCNKNTIIVPSRFNTGLIYGISIDIFPLDTIYADSFDDAIHRLVELKNHLHNSIFTCKPFAIEKSDPISRIKAFFKRIYFKNISRRKDIKKEYLAIESLLYSQEKKERKFYALVQDFSRNDLFEDSIIDGKYFDIEFENYLFKAPLNYDYMLKQFYGDYKELPPEREQVTHHSYKCYYR